MEVNVRCRMSFIVFFLTMFFISGKANALYCSANGQTIQYYGSGGVITVEVDPVTLNKNNLDTLLTDMKAYAICNGSPGSGWKDALRSKSFTLSSDLTKLGYSGYLISNNGVKVASPPDVCLWPDGACSVLNWPNDTTSALNVKLGIERAANSGNWKSGATLSAGTEIARMTTEFRYSGGTWGTNFYWSFVLKNDMIIPVYTCSITQFDNTVTLPKVSRSDLVRHGTGLFPYVNKEFTFNLNCDPQTAVYVTFEGDILSGTGTDQVLENKWSGNPNIGVQLLMNNNPATPVKFSEKFLVAANAQATEVLKFNAYYYYKGGDVSGGGIKSLATFLFDYQ